MKKMDKELIEHIASQLQSHEESYAPGAWERFSEKDKKRRGIIFWPLWSAAALILIFGTLFLVLQQKNEQRPLAVSKTKTDEAFPVPKTPLPLQQSDQKTVPSVTNQLTNQNSSPANQMAKQGSDLVEIKPKENLSLQPNPTEEHFTPGAQLENSMSAGRIATAGYQPFELFKETKKVKPVKKLTFEDLLAQDSRAKTPPTTKSNSNTKWEPGVYVAPSMGNDNKLNMNYGFSLSYNLASKLSISSGIAYNTISSTSNPSVNNVNMSDVVASANVTSKGAVAPTTSKSLESVDASLRGINIPLELKYTISSKFYTGVGVSALAILNDKKDANYLVSTAQNTTVANIAGYSEQKMLLVTERVSETQAATTTSSDKYIGFYNFSFGYKQKISKNKNFAVEPFLRIPMKTFSSDNLNLTNGGLRLKFDF